MAREVIAIKNIIRYTLLIVIVFAACIPALTARAEGGGSADWINGEIVGEKKENESYLAYGDCTNQNVRLLGKYGAYVEQQLCVFSGKSYKYTIEDGMLYVSMGSDAIMYMVYDRGFASRMPVLPSPATDDFIFGGVITKDLPGHLSLVTTPFAKYYTQDPISSQLLTKDEDGSNYFTLEASAVSRNGQWMIVSFKNVGLVRINLADMSATRIAEYVSTTRFLAISNDGKSVAESSVLNQWQPVVYSVENCGQTASVSERAWYDASLPTPCRNKNLYGIVNTLLGTTASSLDGKPEFDDAGQLLLYVYPDGASKTTKVTLHVVGRETDFRLDYLALGDSYSSGEGDNGNPGGKKYYREGTDTEGPPKEKCHVSTRSYPYLLSQYADLKSDQWNSIACSGALVGKDYTGTSQGYYGQGDRLLGMDIDSYGVAAVRDFIPGRVKQVEFIKKYKPRTITITGTGNDADFGPILKACVSPSLTKQGTEETCAYAKDSRGIVMLGEGIKRQYENVRDLIKQIKSASPDTNVYYIGYPQFLQSDDNTCGLGVSLSKTERKVFQAGVTYLNNVIEAATESEGAIFIDIEYALGGHVLCGDDSYVTGYNADCADAANWFIRGFRGKDECQESFHPKSSGHALMATKITTSYPQIIKGDACEVPDTCRREQPLVDVKIPSIFKDAYRLASNSGRMPMRSGPELAAQKGNDEAKITAKVYNLKANANARAYILSDPIEIGTAKVDSSGELLLERSVPANLPAGYHTLHIETDSQDGSPVDLWWVIRIFGAEDDVDEDGIKDSIDGCIFMPTTGRDDNHDNIDDGCDTNVQENPSYDVLEKSSSGGRRSSMIGVTQSSAIFSDTQASDKFNLLAEKDVRFTQTDTQDLSIKSKGASANVLQNKYRPGMSLLFNFLLIIACLVALVFMIKLYSRHGSKKR